MLNQENILSLKEKKKKLIFKENKFFLLTWRLMQCDRQSHYMLSLIHIQMCIRDRVWRRTLKEVRSLNDCHEYKQVVHYVVYKIKRTTGLLLFYIFYLCMYYLTFHMHFRSRVLVLGYNLITETNVFHFNRVLY